MNIASLAGTRYLFFTGKGGVGKTVSACATALHLAGEGRSVLLVSTDPASNLAEVLGTPVENKATPVPGADGLSALAIDPMAAAAAYRERVIEPYRGLWPENEVADLEEQLSGACTVEIAAFDEFAALLSSEPGETFNHIVFDTAPTGHTLRLLQLPGLWTRFLEATPAGASCLGPHSGLKTEQERFREAFTTLRDTALTTIVLVTRPERSPISECDRALQELTDLGIGSFILIVNAVFRATDPDDPIAAAMEQRASEALERLPATLQDLPRITIPMKGESLLGLDALRTFFEDTHTPAAPAEPPSQGATGYNLPPLADLVDELARRESGLIMIMGKGGVGKTTVAAAVAVELAARGAPVHLATTDPAGRPEALLGEDAPAMKVSRIDPAEVTRTYVEGVLANQGKDMSADELEALKEDLRSPCTEEVAVFRAFARLVAGAKREIVVMDTAPTGHTLLLLDATGSYHQEVVRRTPAQGVHNVTTPLMRLQDPAYTHILLVTLPESTPVSEAAELQADLRRASIEPWAWVINHCLAATETTDPVLRQKQALELQQVARVRDGLSDRIAVVPVMEAEPAGAARLRELVSGTSSRRDT